MKKISKRLLMSLLAVMCVFTMLPTMNMVVFADEYEIIDDIDSRFVYSSGSANNGGWDADGSGEANVTEHWSNSAGATLTISFNGTKLELYGKAAPNHAMFSVSIDDGEAVECDAYAGTTDREKMLFESDTLEAGDHKAIIKVLDKRNTNSTGSGNVYGVQFVYAKVLNAQKTEFPGYSIIEDMAMTSSDELFKIKYNGSWGGGSYYPDLFHDGYEHYAHSGDSYEMRFIGTKFEIYASKNAAHGIYDVTIDGEEAGTADGTIVGATKHQQLIYTSPELSDGEHTLKVELKGQDGKAIQLDYLKVYHGEIKADEIQLSEDEIRLESGMSKKIEAKVLPAVATNKTVEWSSADEKIAEVDKDGNITAKSKTTASTKVTAKVKGTDVKAEVKVNVVESVGYLSAFVGSTDMLDTQDNYDDLMTAFNDSYSEVAWKGDVLNSKVVAVTREKDVHNAEIIVSDFTSKGSIIEAGNVDVKWLKNVKANIGRGNSGAPVKDFPDVIYKGGKLDIPAETVQSAWVNINVPKDAKPGVYKGTLTLKADELEKDYVFNYEFEVLDLVLPETSETGQEIQVWQHPFSVANYFGVAEEDYFTEEHYKYMRASMEEYRSIGGVDVVANVVEEAWNHQSYYSDPSMVKWTKKEDGTFAFDYTWYDSWINFQIECGVLDPEKGIGQIKCYSIVPWNNQIAYYDEATNKTVKKSYRPGSDDWNEIWTVFLKDFMEHSEKQGWFDMTYISMDERGMSDLQHAVNVIESVQNNEGESFKISSAFNYGDATGNYEFTDHIDDISIGMIYVSDQSDEMRKLAAHRKELGLTTTIYTCTGHYPGNFTISDPGDNTWVMWYSLSHGTDGFMRWAWDNYVPDPLTNVTYKYWEPGDGWFIYPTEKGEESETYFYSTPRYEMLKKGIRDVNKARYLMETSKENEQKVKELIETMKRPKSGGNGYGSAVAANETERMLTFSETARMKEGINTIAREYIANQVVEVEGIEVDVEEVTLFEGESQQVTATVKPENATDKNVFWTSEDETVATVSDGKITAVKEGETIVKVYSADEIVRAQIKVIVKKVTETKPNPEEPDTDDKSDSTDDVNSEDVNTGDTTNVMFWSLLCICGAFMSLFAISKKVSK